jgi:DNA-binding FadR family transcriptional regulator
LAVRLSAEKEEQKHFEGMRVILAKAREVLQENQHAFYPWNLNFHRQILHMALNPNLM